MEVTNRFKTWASKYFGTLSETAPVVVGSDIREAYEAGYRDLGIEVSEAGLRFGECFISHEAIINGRGPVVTKNYQAWLSEQLKTK